MTNKIIVANVCFVIFSLASAFTGTVAWFIASGSASTTISSFSVANRKAEIESVTLYKFVYKSYLVDGVTYYDYISPAKGGVKTYSYDFDLDQFGAIVESKWVRVNEMNLYDPDAYRIYGNNLNLLNCNAVYKITFSSSDFVDADLYISALKKNVVAGDNILLSSCADFNIYQLEELNPEIEYPIPSPEEDENDYRLYKTENGRPVLTDGLVTPAWHPTYKSSEFSDEEEVYYKVSRLASVSSHESFYGADNPSSQKIALNGGDPLSITFEDGHFSIYLNVNYAPSTLTRYNGMDMNEQVRALYDCAFSFYFE